MSRTIESKVAQTILQHPEEIEICGEVFQVIPPTVATIIEMSAAISELPHEELDKNNIVAESLFIAKDCEVLGDVAAILILGSKGLVEKRKIITKKFFGLIKEEFEVEINHKAILAKKLLDSLSPSKLNELIVRLSQKIEYSDFFALTTFLMEINMLKQTREVVKA